MFAQILEYEAEFGRAEGKEERLICVRWAYDRWCDRRSLGGRLLDVAARVDRAPVGSDDSKPVVRSRNSIAAIAKRSQPLQLRRPSSLG